jgi:hypothetical protein
MLEDGYTAEVRRVRTDGTYNACSMLMRAAWRATKALGYRRIINYTLPEEAAASLRAAGSGCSRPTLAAGRGAGKTSQPPTIIRSGRNTDGSLP